MKPGSFFGRFFTAAVAVMLAATSLTACDGDASDERVSLPIADDVTSSESAPEESTSTTSSTEEEFVSPEADDAPLTGMVEGEVYYDDGFVMQYISDEEIARLDQAGEDLMIESPLGDTPVVLAFYNDQNDRTVIEISINDRQYYDLELDESFNAQEGNLRPSDLGKWLSESQINELNCILDDRPTEVYFVTYPLYHKITMEISEMSTVLSYPGCDEQPLQRRNTASNVLVYRGPWAHDE